MEVGKDSVVMGNVDPKTKVGDGSVVMGATDARGNAIYNTPMAVGHGAKAGPNSIAVGANASAGVTESPPPKKIKEQEKPEPAPDHWYKKPIPVIGITVVGGLVLACALYLMRIHWGFP